MGPGAAAGSGWWRVAPGIVASDRGRWLVEQIRGVLGMTEVFLGIPLRERHGGLAWIYKA